MQNDGSLSLRMKHKKIISHERYLDAPSFVSSSFLASTTRDSRSATFPSERLVRFLTSLSFSYYYFYNPFLLRGAHLGCTISSHGERFLGLMKSSTNWAGIVMGARLFIPKVVFAFLFSLPRIIIFYFCI